MLEMQKQDGKRILTAEMSWLWKIAGVSRLQKIRIDDMGLRCLNTLR